MPNTSATGGPLLPSSSAPSDDDALVDFLNAVIAGITGLSGTLIRPRWQERPPPLPPVGTTWMATGIGTRSGDTFPEVEHDPDGEGADNLNQHEEFVLDCTFYGPAAQSTATLLRDGLNIAQNREVLDTNGVKFIATGPMPNTPEVVNQRWLMRTDMPITFRREVGRTYPVLNIIEAVGTVVTDVPARSVPFDTDD